MVRLLVLSSYCNQLTPPPPLCVNLATLGLDPPTSLPLSSARASAYVASRPGPCHSDGVNAEQISLLQVTQSATWEIPALLYYSPPLADLGFDIGLGLPTYRVPPVVT